MIVIERPSPSAALLRLSRPDQLNALSLAAMDELGRQAVALAAEPEVRCIVLASTGRAFSAGLDLSELGPGLEGAVPEGMALQEAAVEAIHRIRQVDLPTIAAIDGLALGGGLALALCCDMRIASPRASFETGVQRLGLSGCDLGMSWFLPRLAGASIANDMMMAGRRLDAQEALTHGLVSRVVEDVESTALEMAAAIAGHAPLGMRLTKQTARANVDATSIRAAIELENRTQVLALQTADVAAAAAAVRGGSVPHFEGR